MHKDRVKFSRTRLPAGTQLPDGWKVVSEKYESRGVVGFGISLPTGQPLRATVSLSLVWPILAMDSSER